MSLAQRSLKETSERIFEGLARTYERVLDYATLYQDRRWKAWAVERVGIRPGDVVLDVGSGTLVLEELLKDWKVEFVALDLSPEMIKVGQAKAVPNVSLLLNGDAEALPFAAKSFDAIVSCYVPKYVDLPTFAAELGRVAKPGAGVALYDFARPRGVFSLFLELYIQGGLRLLGLALRLLGREEAFTFLNLPRIIRLTRWDEEVQGAMEAGGFSATSVRRLTGGAVCAYSGTRRGSA